MQNEKRKAINELPAKTQGQKLAIIILQFSFCILSQLRSSAVNFFFILMGPLRVVLGVSLSLFLRGVVRFFPKRVG
jgi:hypothetical protein